MSGIMSEGSVEGTAPRCAAHPGSRSPRLDALDRPRSYATSPTPPTITAYNLVRLPKLIAVVA